MDAIVDVERSKAYFPELALRERDLEEVALVITEFLGFHAEIVDEVTRVVEDDTIIVLFDSLDNMGTMPMNEVDSLVDEPVAK